MKLRSFILSALLLGSSCPAFSQGCAMCYSTAAGASPEGQKAIRTGIVVLLVPPLGFMSLGVWMASRYARKRDLEESRQTQPGETSTKARVFVARTTHPRVQHRGIL